MNAKMHDEYVREYIERRSKRKKNETKKEERNEKKTRFPDRERPPVRFTSPHQPE